MTCFVLLGCLRVEVPDTASFAREGGDNTVKKTYQAPQIIEYGVLSEITLGTGGSLPDYVSGQVVNNNCGSQTFTGTLTSGATTTFTRSACLASG